MSENVYCDNPWLLFNLNQHKFAMPTRFTQELVNFTSLELATYGYSYIKGSVNLRGQRVPLIDLRVLLNMPSSLQEIREFVLLLRKCRGNYTDWLSNSHWRLQRSEKIQLPPNLQEIDLTKWYKHFHFEQPDISVALQQLCLFQRSLVQSVRQLNAMLKTSDKRNVMEYANWMKDRRIDRIIEMFDQLIDMIDHSLTYAALVVNYKNTLFALSVDSVEDVEATTQVKSRAPLYPCGDRLTFAYSDAQYNDFIYLVDIEELAQRCSLACAN